MSSGVKQTGSQKFESGHQDVVHDVAMDYYGKRIATCSADRTIKLFGLNASDTPTLLASLTGHEGPVWQVSWAHPKFGSMLASCSYDRRVIIWREGQQENDWSQVQVFKEHEASVNSISWAPHELGLCLACGSSDGSITVFTGREDGSWDKTKIDQAHQVGVTAVSWAPASAPGSLVGQPSDPIQKLVSGGCDNTAKVWKFYNGSWKLDCFPPLQMHTDWVRDVAWAPNLGLPKSTIASCSEDGKVVIWTQWKEGDKWEGKILNAFKTPVWRVSWSLTGNILAVADGNNNVTLWKEAVDGEWNQFGAEPRSGLPVYNCRGLFIPYQGLNIPAEDCLIPSELCDCLPNSVEDCRILWRVAKSLPRPVKVLLWTVQPLPRACGY